MKPIRPIEWIPNAPDAVLPGRIRFIDQTLLPTECRYLETTELETVWYAIRTLQVRGAPAIGIAAAMGVAAAAQDVGGETRHAVEAAHAAADYLSTARPTAVNLFWALDRMRRAIGRGSALPSAAFRESLVREAIAIREEDAAMCQAIGRHGAALLKDGDTVLTHCNAGALATAEMGTALAPVYTANQGGRNIRVISCETRPLLQGSRLTAWELAQAGVDVTVICDNMTAQVMREGRVQAVMVGADRIAANGDAANKIGTYGVAVLARAHHIPFYVLAPTSTFDPATATGADIPIEQRDGREITDGFGRRTAPDGVKVYNPAFDVTPAELIAGIVCERGVLRPDYRLSIAGTLAAQGLNGA